jgi:hypothetical protein
MLVTRALTVSSWSSKNMTRTSSIAVKIVAVSCCESLVLRCVISHEMECFINTAVRTAKLQKKRLLKFATSAYIHSLKQFLPHVALEGPVV